MAESHEPTIPEDPDDPTIVQQDMFGRDPGPTIAEDVGGRRTVQLKSYKSLERLRDRIMLASRELARLRTENADLQRQVDELKLGGGAIDGTPVVFTESPAALRTKVEGFIEAIDQYLEDDFGEELRSRGDGGLMARSIRVQILGRDYTLRVREENEDMTRQIAEYVDGKMSVFRNAHPEQSDTTAAVMTAMAVAEELFLERATREEVRDAVDTQLGDLEKQLAEALTSRR